MIAHDSERLKQEVREYWNTHPCGTQFTHLVPGSKEFYDEVERYRYASQPFMRRLMGFDRFRGNRLLEIGCGLGTDLLQFARGGAEVAGVDLTPVSIELVKTRFAMAGLPVNAQVADAENLPFSDNSFDVVYSFGVLHHTPDTQKAVDEVLRVLKPGGQIIIMLYHRRSIHVWAGGPIHAIGRRKRKDSGSAVEDWVRIYDGEENPLGKSYTRSEVRHMFRKFRGLTLEFCDPMRRKYPAFVNTINQLLLARWFGFWMVIKGYKEATMFDGSVRL